MMSVAEKRTSFAQVLTLILVLVYSIQVNCAGTDGARKRSPEKVYAYRQQMMNQPPNSRSTTSESSGAEEDASSEVGGVLQSLDLNGLNCIVTNRAISKQEPESRDENVIKIPIPVRPGPQDRKYPGMIPELEQAWRQQPLDILVDPRRPTRPGIVNNAPSTQEKTDSMTTHYNLRRSTIQKLHSHDGPIKKKSPVVSIGSTAHLFTTLPATMPAITDQITASKNNLSFPAMKNWSKSPFMEVFCDMSSPKGEKEIPLSFRQHSTRIPKQAQPQKTTLGIESNGNPFGFRLRPSFVAFYDGKWTHDVQEMACATKELTGETKDKKQMLFGCQELADALSDETRLAELGIDKDGIFALLVASWDKTEIRVLMTENSPVALRVLRPVGEGYETILSSVRGKLASEFVEKDDVVIVGQSSEMELLNNLKVKDPSESLLSQLSKDHFWTVSILSTQKTKPTAVGHEIVNNAHNIQSIQHEQRSESQRVSLEGVTQEDIFTTNTFSTTPQEEMGPTNTRYNLRKRNGQSTQAHLTLNNPVRGVSQSNFTELIVSPHETSSDPLTTSIQMLGAQSLQGSVVGSISAGNNSVDQRRIPPLRTLREQDQTTDNSWDPRPFERSLYGIESASLIPAKHPQRSTGTLNNTPQRTRQQITPIDEITRMSIPPPTNHISNSNATRTTAAVSSTIANADLFITRRTQPLPVHAISLTEEELAKYEILPLCMPLSQPTKEPEIADISTFQSIVSNRSAINQPLAPSPEQSDWFSETVKTFSKMYSKGI